MREFCDRGILAVLLVALAGCVSGDIVAEDTAAGFVDDAAAKLAAVKWSQAETLRVELSEFEFKPPELAFREGAGYRLILRNGGDRRHTFASGEFFKAIAVQKLISEDGMIEAPRLEAIEVLPGSEKELRFVPVRKGSYALECTVPLHGLFGMVGRITVQ